MDTSPVQDFTAPPRILLEARPSQGERLNVVLPHLDAALAFGGIATAMELARVLAGSYREARLISQMPLPLPQDMFAPPATATGARAQAVSLADGRPLPCRTDEVFLCTHWSTVGVWEAYDQAMRQAGITGQVGQIGQPGEAGREGQAGEAGQICQAGRAGFSAPDFYYFIQDFEPDFLPEGPARNRALASYAHGERCHAVINSFELARHFEEAGYRFARTYPLPPSLNPDLTAFLDARGWMLSKPRPDPLVILVYGRPTIPRNRFQEAAEGLALHLESLTEHERSRTFCLSAGQPHPDIMLCPGAVLKSLGKLELTRYAALLEQAHVGLSLMASPHPSYPPLEMALFGLMTVTNRHGGKDLAGTHPGIVSIPAPTPGEVARGLALARQLALAAPARRKAVLPSSMSPLPWGLNLSGLGLTPIRASGHTSVDSL